MATELVILPEAEQDIDEAYAWYEERQEGLGERFLAQVDATLDMLRRQPLMHQVVHEQYRRAVLRRFPYVIFYEAVGDRVTIYSVFHTSQDPAKWRKRLGIEDD